MGVVSTKLRKSAKGQPCTIRSSYCNHDPETTVLAHLPSPIKGMGNKGDDWHAVFACSACHEALDTHLIEAGKYLLTSLQRTQRVWFEMGLLNVPVTEKRAKPSPKIMARRSLGTGVFHD